MILEHPEAKSITWPNAFITRTDEGVRSRHGAYRFRLKGTERGEPSEVMTSLLQIYDYGSWRLKFRITYPATDSEAADRIKAFHMDFPWPEPETLRPRSTQ